MTPLSRMSFLQTDKQASTLATPPQYVRHFKSHMTDSPAGYDKFYASGVKPVVIAVFKYHTILSPQVRV
ncbi:hypothetical protein [Endozoicomonas sp. Mp262]|uniref:hypothetical protein n=1 Tax=Endozoicomonas sp. Mp262 TaxID=2919499 RepID=UPI0021DFDF5C